MSDDAPHDDAVRRTGKAARPGRTAVAGVPQPLALAPVTASAGLPATALALARTTAGTE
ncbi:hypothetical protein GCM10019016_026630 [Streptomyces prasinosporus]|uniref:Uncharacterized protein n=1 Tax=Streptomyces prasinosporus TaxID=68256 RepID=A0ABP6TLF8_9ACTN